MFLIVHVDEETYLVPLGETFYFMPDNLQYMGVTIEPFIAADRAAANQYMANHLGWDREDVANVTTIFPQDDPPEQKESDLAFFARMCDS